MSGVFTGWDLDDLQVYVNIEIPDEIIDFNQLDSALSKAMRDMANEARNYWISEAGKRLKTSRQEYIDAIAVNVVNETSFSLTLTGALAYRIEAGSPPYKMYVARGQIVPLNVNREVPMTNPIFRTGTGEPWQHPGFDGIDLSSDVEEYIEETLVPKYFGEAIDSLK